MGLLTWFIGVIGLLTKSLTLQVVYGGATLPKALAD